MLTQERLKELVNYDPATGAFTWRVGRPKAAAGSIAGFVNEKGYWLIGIDGKHQRAHRLAWLYVYGAWPKHQIDHINHDKLDNRIDNLREVTNAKNHRNMGMQSNNTSGYRGVSFCKHKQKWTARIRSGKVYKNLGYFAYATAAAVAYERAKLKLGYHPNHGNVKGA